MTRMNQNDIGKIATESDREEKKITEMEVFILFHHAPLDEVALSSVYEVNCSLLILKNLSNLLL